LFPDFSLEESVKIIQNNERGRQGMLRAKYMKDLRQEAEREKKMMAKMLINNTKGDEETILAVITIQRYYKGFRQRKKLQKIRQDELYFLGMAENPTDSKNDPVLKQIANRERRKVLQKQFEEDYLQALITTKDKILRMEGPDMKEAIQDDFRQWYMEYKRINGKFPDFPSEAVWKLPEFRFSVDYNHEAKLNEEEKTEKDGGKKDKKGDKKEVC
jgi:hypothetical protein